LSAFAVYNESEIGLVLIRTREDSGYLDGKFVALGKVIAGMEVVKRIEGVKVTPPSNKPQKSIVISNCGIL